MYIKISLILILCHVSPLAIACSGWGSYTDQQTKLKYQDAIITYKINNKKVFEFMDKKYGINKWSFKKIRSAKFKHQRRPSALLNNNNPSTNLYLLYEFNDLNLNRAKQKHTVQLHTKYENIDVNVIEIGIRVPGNSEKWTTLTRYWLVEEKTTSTGDTVAILDNNPWAYYTTHCGYGSAVVSTEENNLTSKSSSFALAHLDNQKTCSARFWLPLT